MAERASPTRASGTGRDVVVTGGSGFLGRFVVGRLEDAGARGPRPALGGARPAHRRGRGRCGRRRRHRPPPRGQRRRHRLQPPQPGPVDPRQPGDGDERVRAGAARRRAQAVAACSVCAYPKFTPVPFREDDLWDGYPEESNAPYGIAKKMLLVLSDAYAREYGFDSAVPVIANLYGPGDNYDLNDSHVIAAMIRKFVEAAERGDDEVVLWGTGSRPASSSTSTTPPGADPGRGVARRGRSRSTSAPAARRRSATSPSSFAPRRAIEGEIRWDTSMPDGQAERFLDVAGPASCSATRPRCRSKRACASRSRTSRPDGSHTG